jgi:glycerophosphoryl diester phosphodiesterase
MRCGIVAVLVLGGALIACGGGSADAEEAAGHVTVQSPATTPAPAAAPTPGVNLPPFLNTVIAHRGNSGKAPENTLSAYIAATGAGVKWVETDAQITKDGHLVLMHDDLVRTTNVKNVFPGRAAYGVGNFTLAEIKLLDAGSWFNARFAGEKVPTLSELLLYLRGTGVGLHLEIKSSTVTAAPTLSSELIAAEWIVKRGVEHQPVLCTDSRVSETARRGRT